MKIQHIGNKLSTRKCFDFVSSYTYLVDEMIWYTMINHDAAFNISQETSASETYTRPHMAPASKSNLPSLFFVPWDIRVTWTVIRTHTILQPLTENEVCIFSHRWISSARPKSAFACHVNSGEDCTQKPNESLINATWHNYKVAERDYGIQINLFVTDTPHKVMMIGFSSVARDQWPLETVEKITIINFSVIA